MLEDFGSQSFLSLTELTHLRMEAMQLFERGITNGDISDLVSFIERQLSQDPPRLLLLRDLADDLQQRLLSLREHHFDVRERVVRTLREGYGVDIGRLAPADALDRYHMLAPDAVLAFVCEASPDAANDAPLLLKMIEASVQMAAQLHQDIALTAQVYGMVLDWLEGMNATVARRYWRFPNEPEQPHAHLH